MTIAVAYDPQHADVTPFPTSTFAFDSTAEKISGLPLIYLMSSIAIINYSHLASVEFLTVRTVMISRHTSFCLASKLQTGGELSSRSLKRVSAAATRSDALFM